MSTDAPPSRLARARRARAALGATSIATSVVIAMLGIDGAFAEWGHVLEASALAALLAAIVARRAPARFTPSEQTSLALPAVGIALVLPSPIVAALIQTDGAFVAFFNVGAPIAVTVWQVWRMAVVYARDPETRNGPGAFGWLVLASALPFIAWLVLSPSRSLLPPALLQIPIVSMTLALLVYLPLQLWIRFRARRDRHLGTPVPRAIRAR